MAQDGNEAFQAHVVLAVRNPTDFGFADAEEARRATLGWSYRYYSTDEWASLTRKPCGKLDIEANPSPRRLTEVLGPDGKPRCAFIQARNENGDWGPGVLGFKNLSEGLTVLSRHPRRQHLVLLVDSETRRLHFVDTDNPNQIQTVELEP